MRAINPAYRLDYEKLLAVVKQFIARFENLQITDLAHRTGQRLIDDAARRRMRRFLAMGLPFTS